MGRKGKRTGRSATKPGPSIPAGSPKRAAEPPNLPFEQSVGYQIRITHRLVQRYLQSKIEPYGVTLGMWYFFRALWARDGMTQRELSLLIGTKDPTTLSAIITMEKAGFIKRVRNEDDRRKINIFLTERGQKLKKILMPVALEVVTTVTAGFSPREADLFMSFLSSIRKNIEAELGEVTPDDGYSD